MMKKMNIVGVLIAGALLLFSSSAMAQGGQAAKNALRTGQTALAFQVPSGGNPFVPGTLGYHYMLSDNMRLGVNLGLNVDSTTTNTVNDDGDLEEDDSFTSFGLQLAPQINYYTKTKGTVAPYFFGLLRFSTFSDGDDETTGDFQEVLDDEDGELGYNAQEQSSLSLAAGAGVEWFPVTRFSISGQVGLNLSILSPDSGDPDAGVLTEEGFGLNLFTSSLAANIYF